MLWAAWRLRPHALRKMTTGGFARNVEATSTTGRSVQASTESFESGVAHTNEVGAIAQNGAANLAARANDSSEARTRRLYTRRQLLAVDQGWPIPRAGARTSEPGTPTHERGRPTPRGMNFANKYLLERFPQLKDDPFAFAGLERLHRADGGDRGLALLPTPEEWAAQSEESTSGRSGYSLLNKVRNRSKDRIRRALAQEGIAGVPDGVAPHTRWVERLESEPSSDKIGREAKGAAAGKSKARKKRQPQRAKPSKPSSRRTHPGPAHRRPSGHPAVRPAAKARSPRR